MGGVGLRHSLYKAKHLTETEKQLTLEFLEMYESMNNPQREWERELKRKTRKRMEKMLKRTGL